MALTIGKWQLGADRAVESDALRVALESGNDLRAMELLVDEHGDHVYLYCRRMLGNDLEGDDVSQIVFEQAFRRLKDFLTVKSPRAWLLGIARHRCLDRLRATRRAKAQLDRDRQNTIAAMPATESLSGDLLEHRALDECLDQLGPRSRAALVMRFYDEMSFDEMCQIMSDTDGALRVRVARALKAVRTCLESKGVIP